MLGFRVSVCLTRFFNDERSYCYIYLDKQTYGTISAFEQYLRRQFHLPDPFCLMTSSNLLPSDQTTNIISYGDVITVIPLKKDWRLGEEVILIENKNNNESHNITSDVVDNVDVPGLEKTSKKKKKKKGKPENAEASTSHEDETAPLKTEKPYSLENYIEMESEKKKDSDMDILMGIDDGDKYIEQQLDQLDKDDNDGDTERDEQNNELYMKTLEPQRLAEMQSTIQQLKLKALSLLNDVASQKQVAGVSGGRINKRKRIRKRNKNTPLSVSTPDLTDTEATQPITFKPVKQSASHIRFENDQTTAVQDYEMILKTIRDSEITTKPRIIHAIENNIISTSRRSSVCGTPEPKNVGPCNSNVYPATNTILNGNSKMQAREEQMITIENVKNRLCEFPVMDNVPVVKDLVLFKMLKLRTDYTPGLSDYILGSVLEVDKPNGIVKVSIADGQKECISTMEEADSTGELIIDVSWCQVTEPRLIVA